MTSLTTHYDTDKSDDGWIMGSPVRREKESDPINTRLQILKDRVLTCIFAKMQSDLE